MKRILLTCFLFSLVAALRSQTTKEIINRLKTDIPSLMQKAEIPGLSAALIRDGKLVWFQSFGVMNRETKQPVTDHTLFEAASLSKVVFAYGVLKLVDAGKLDLDVPLNTYLGNNYEVGNDPRINLITARRVLSHTTGFPNWRNNEKDLLPIQFTPGERFGYSGEGFVYLSRVVEKITGIPLETYYEQNVFAPLGMTHSSYVWQDSFDSSMASRHNTTGNVTDISKGKFFNAAASLRTTAEDYGRFIAALLMGNGLSANAQKEMFSPQINVKASDPQVFWGVGVGLEKINDHVYFWHWGDQGDSKAFMKADIAAKNAIVYFTNSANGLAITKEILDDAVGGTHPSIAWLDYEHYDGTGYTFYKTALQKGAAMAIGEYIRRKNSQPTDSISEGRMNSIGYDLLRLKKIDDAILVFQKNADDHPLSANTWDSLAEGYVNKGDKESAIRYYEKTLLLNPSSVNAQTELKKLKGN